MLQTSHGTIGNDQIFLRQKAKENIREYLDERLPDEYERCMVGINSILREAWNTSKQDNIDNKEKIQALSLAKECYSMKLDLLTNATVVSDAVKFVSEHNNKKSDGATTSESTEQKSEDLTATAAEEETTNKVFE
jgi:hypothetical protein